jgi:guanosine-3',5'-bis(diphosphate) 3'-pyrophosphohydrolase
LAITLKNVPGAIAKITSTLAHEGVDIRALGMLGSSNQEATLESIVVVANRKELYLLIRLIRKIDVCKEVVRILNKPE